MATNEHKMRNNKDLLTAREVSEYLRIPLRTIHRLSKDGKIKAVKIGKQWRYRRFDIEQYYSLGTDFSKEPVRRLNEFVERRTYPRINSNLKCQFSINLPSFKGINDEGIIRNLSAGGVSLFIQRERMREVEIDDPIDLDFNLNGKRESINVKVEGRILRKNGNGLGIKFREISSEVKDRIIKYVG